MSNFILSKYPARVRRAVAMQLLCIENDDTFKKVVDANPGLAHKLPGETESKYLTEVIAKLLQPTDSSRCATRGEEKKDSAASTTLAAKKRAP